MQRRTVMRSPAPSTSPDRLRSSSKQSHHSQSQSHRPGSSDSDTSASSHLTSLSVQKHRSPYTQQLPSFVSHANNSNTSVASNTRPSAQYMPQDGHVRKQSPLGPPAELQKHRPRQHSQGFFEPSMPSASLASQSTLDRPQHVSHRISNRRSSCYATSVGRITPEKKIVNSTISTRTNSTRWEEGKQEFSSPSTTYSTSSK